MTNRRAFLTRLTSVAGAAVAGGAVGASARTQAGRPPSGASPRWDLGWLEQMQGRHKHVLDLGAFDLSLDTPLRQAVTFLAGIEALYHLEPPHDVDLIVAISHHAFPMNATDPLWVKYRIGEHWKIVDPATGKPSTRNIFVGEPSGRNPATVRALQARGVLFWQCNMALGSISQELAQAYGGDARKIRDDLAAGLHPWVRLVASHTAMLNVVQQHGFTYESL